VSYHASCCCDSVEPSYRLGSVHLSPFNPVISCC
ncbi:unnamed protein product, partial [Arabidopsis halleri]